MPLNYSIVLLGNPRKPDDPKKAYARSQVSKELTLKGLSQRVAAQTTVSRADVSAVLISVVENMIEALRDGEQVDFGELGKFRLQATSRGADSAEVFTATNITGVNIQFVPGDDLKKIFNGMSFNPVPSRASVRAVLRAEKAGETTVDLSKKPNEGGGSGGEDVNPAKRKAMVAKNEKRFLKQKRNVLQKSESLSFRSDYPVKIQASFKRLLKAV